MLEARDLTLWQGDRLLLDRLGFTLDDGEAVQVLGRNGAGKTTLLRALIGLAEIDEGDVLWDGGAFSRQRDALYDTLIYLGHRNGLVPELTALENLRYLCPSVSSGDAVIGEALATLGMSGREDLPVAMLSAGQRRRTALARLLIEPARLWVLDEPLTSLDVDGGRWLADAIERQLDRGGSVIFTSHQPLPTIRYEIRTLHLAGDSEDATAVAEFDHAEVLRENAGSLHENLDGATAIDTATGSGSGENA
ncbi:MAG: heme ABC transporter ATP-binding protein CcmA [Gammaproteobacteria bacterium]|nr:MAG: heme ABC transporter ATP-binding protein CcmA [Gammaproteobacteria bacterium]PIE36279.1 MAG: heme ABC transporter ATP-binding protein CcmA [Gammaproteobacteria bacterium]